MKYKRNKLSGAFDAQRRWASQLADSTRQQHQWLGQWFSRGHE